ncbi:uncharacterized protein CBL_20714, partial [Carabus blaptoides fortunei]
MAPPFGPNDILKISGLLNMMKADETSLVAKKDNIICEVVRRYIKSHREKHQLLVAKRYMRRLARLVIADLIIGSKAIAEYDEKERVSKSPSLALQMGTLLKHATNTTISHEMQKGKEYFSQERLHYLQTLISLIETDWALEISSEAGQNLQINKFNKPSLIPIAEDIKIMSYEKEQEELKTLYDLFCAKSDNELEEGDRYSESEPEEFQDDGEFNGDPDFVPVVSDDSENENDNEDDQCETLDEGSEDTEEEDASDTWQEDVKPIIDFDFDTKNSGPIDMDTSSRINIFKKMFSDEVLDMLVTSTNIYGEKLCQLNRPSTRNRRILSFKKTNTLEMSQFLGLCLLKSQVRAPSIRHLFSNDILYYHPIFHYIMSGRRFEQILRCLSCYEKPDQKKISTETKLGKVSDLVSLVIKNFQQAYMPGEKLSLDESLLLFRGRLSFRQYIKSKKARYGIKFFELTTFDGYVLNLEIYQGKAAETDGKTSSIVKRLMAPYLNRGHHLYMDNFYNSVGLSKELLELKTHTTGTLRRNRKENPKVVVNQKLKRGEYIWRRSGDVYVSKWHDKRDVIVISTANHPELIEVRNRFNNLKVKPRAVSDYNENMSGVDRCDQMVEYYSSP